MIEVFQMLQKAKTCAMPLGNHVTQEKLTETTENRLALTKTPNLAFSGSFRYILLYLGVIPPHSGVIPPHSGIFRHHSCPFRFIPVLFHLIPVYSGMFRSVPVFSNARPSGLFCLILLSFCLVPVYSGTILVYSVSFWCHSVLFQSHYALFRHIQVYSALFVCHSGSFRYIPVPFLFIPSHSGVIPPHSSIFRLIPVYSVPFLCLVTPGFPLSLKTNI